MKLLEYEEGYIEDGLNSTMFRWNFSYMFVKLIHQEKFKFHYVQMKQVYQKLKEYLPEKRLNSTMFRWNFPYRKFSEDVAALIV